MSEIETLGTSDRILRLRRLIALQFREEHWQYLALLTRCGDLVGAHERLGQLHWGDNGYDACVLLVLTAMHNRCPEKLPAIEAYVESVCSAAGEHGLSNATLVRL